MNVIVALILLFIVVLAIRLKFEFWMYERKSREVLGLFARSGALSPANAKPPNDFGLRLSAWRFGLRDYRSEAFRVLVLKRLVLKTSDGRFYLSPEGYRLHTKYRNE